MAHNVDGTAVLWEEARKRYAETTGKDFNSIPTPRTTDDLLQSVARQNNDHKHFREKKVEFT